MSSAVDRLHAARTAFVGLWMVATLAGAALLIAAMVPVGPAYLATAGAMAVATTYAWGLAARTGGRPVIFGGFALVLSAFVVVVDHDILRTGAAVLVATAAAVLGVMSTVPAPGFAGAAREALVATSLAAIGGLAALGFEPAIRVARFEYVVMALALLGCLILVHRLGAGFHGLGRRGLIVVAVGGVVLLLGLLYGELLRSHATTGVVDTLVAWVRWSRENLGGYPRPMTALVGIPALVYGCHMRARRRQGWWMCAFGVAATAPATTILTNPAIGVAEAVLTLSYGVVVGLALGWLLIRLDLLLSGSRGKRSRAAEKDAAVRPEPARIEPLL